MNIQINKLLEQFTDKHILVIGDVMLDEYIWGKVNRVSPEAPVPVVKLDCIDYHAGGAANVAENSLPVYVDPKDNYYDCYSGARLLKPNLSEFLNKTDKGHPLSLIHI